MLSGFGFAIGTEACASPASMRVPTAPRTMARERISRSSPTLQDDPTLKDGPHPNIRWPIFRALSSRLHISLITRQEADLIISGLLRDQLFARSRVGRSEEKALGHAIGRKAPSWRSARCSTGAASSRAASHLPTWLRQP